MALSAVKTWFGRPIPELVEATRPIRNTELALGRAAVVPLVSSRPPLSWSPARLVTTDALWGEGFQFPGGEGETLRLARPMGLSKASSLLLVGAGGGGPICSLAVQLGVLVSGFEADPTLLAAATERLARGKLTRRAQIESWNAEEPNLREHFYHHGLALEPLQGRPPELVLTAIARALKPSGHLMLIELVADVPLDPADPDVAAWAHLERRDPRAMPTELAITRTLGRLGFEVRVAEDMSERRTHYALMGWRTRVRAMKKSRPTRQDVVQSVQEAELWMFLLRLLQRGALRLVRWHAVGSGG
jgi:SAM-dependent methyltransferase